MLTFWLTTAECCGCDVSAGEGQKKTGICSDWSVSSERSYSSRVYLFLQRSRCLCSITKSCCRVWCICMGKARTRHGTFSMQICCPVRDVQHVSSASSVLVRAAVQRSLKISEMKLKKDKVSYLTCGLFIQSNRKQVANKSRPCNSTRS